MTKSTAKLYVSYIRVSTERQGVSGLGLSAQQAAIQAHMRDNPERTLAKEFREVESGKRNDRPQLLMALSYCRLIGATLLVAKLDRLSRNVAFLTTLMEQGVPFTAADMPFADETQLQMMIVFAAYEAKKISQRTKAALAQSKKKLGGLRISPERFAEISVTARKMSAAARTEKATKRSIEVLPHIAAIQASGATSLKQIAAQLNQGHIKTPKGGSRSAVQVQRVLARAW